MNSSWPDRRGPVVGSEPPPWRDCLLAINHWDQPGWQGSLPLHITLWETITSLIFSVDLFWVNMEFSNCNRSKSWWIRLFNLAYCNTCNVMVSYTVWYKLSLCSVPPYWYKSVRFEQYWHTEQSAEIFSVILSFRPRGRWVPVRHSAQLPTTTRLHTATLPHRESWTPLPAFLRPNYRSDDIVFCIKLNTHSLSLSLSLSLSPSGLNWRQITV